MADEGVRAYTLTRLSSEIARSLAPIGRVAVPGEVAGPPSTYSSGAYFTLKDRQFVLSVHVPGKHLSRSHLVAGERVEVTGTLRWHPGTGRLQLVAEEVVPVGAGAAAAMVEAARRRLAEEGLLDRPRRVIPLLPAAVGVVCGADAAVRHDIASVAAGRFPGLPVRYEECTVTGPGAAASIVEALARLLRDESVEVVILARGGGDATQLLPWSDEELCRMVAAAPVPVVSAIGHEEDRPLVDEVADERCGTPSIAAARVVPDLAGLRGRLDLALRAAAERADARTAFAARRLELIDPRRSLEAAVVSATRRLDAAGHRVALVHPVHLLGTAEASLARLDPTPALQARLEGAAARLATAGCRLDDLGPRQVLRRGYAVVRLAGGGVVRDPTVLAPGDRVEVEVEGGRFVAVVEGSGA